MARNNKYNYVGDPPSLAAIEALSTSISHRVAYDNVIPPVVGAVVPRDYNDTDIHLLNILQTSVEMEIKNT